MVPCAGHDAGWLPRDSSVDFHSHAVSHLNRHRRPSRRGASGDPSHLGAATARDDFYEIVLVAHDKATVEVTVRFLGDALAAP